MKFWDSSALLPLLLVERTSEAMREVSAADRQMVVAFITPIEVASGVVRRTRALPQEKREYVALQLEDLQRSWRVIDDYAVIISNARDLVVRHRLRAADAIQLAAALLACEGDTSTLPFVTLDDELRDAASTEGFPTLP